ncbi:MAG: chemotaxis-specific protein-glutamate methyltransferase CheB [Planctomycetaceae bacterium]|nr:chemotaxis-specific protein-glutamate methyltransferase CheB [Planctomycetaceae bacterium]
MIRLLIVEDSVTQREIFRRLFAEDGEFTVVAEAATGEEAIRLVQKHVPDVVLMDIHMPGMGGIEATREIMRVCPVPIVVASATLRKQDVNLAMKAIEAGAVSVIEKPQGAVLLHLQKIAPQLRAELVAASQAVLRRRPLHHAAVRAPATNSAKMVAVGNVEMIGVATSTGGPPVLLEIFSALPKPFPLPVLLVQHISEGFVEGFARWLGDMTGQPTRLATDGARLEPGIWLAPGGRHLALANRARIELPLRRDSDLHCPSANVLFDSLSRHAGTSSLGILLTGMGDDGARGLLALKQAGGHTVIQDEASSLIWGMPKSAKELGAANQELNPAEIVRVMMKAASIANL